jgi:hypothetical protein
MSRFSVVLVAVAAAGGLIAAPPPEPDVQKLVAKLSDPDEKVRNEASAALKGRADALPWLRRAARSKAPITSARANRLLEPQEKKRQEVAAKAIDACVREGRIDLLTEWHQYWKPEEEKDLWAVGPRAAKAGLDLFAKSCPKDAWERFEKRLALQTQRNTQAHDGPCPERFEAFKGAWLIRTDRMDQLPHGLQDVVQFASVGGPVRLSSLDHGAQYLVLGPVEARKITTAFVACDGGIGNRTWIACSVVVCRGNFTGELVGDSVLLVDGDIDLTRAEFFRTNLIRATGEIRLPKNNAVDSQPQNSDIKAHVKDATAPYKFFELPDVGLSLADDEVGLVVTAVKPGTPFGDCDIRKGDLVRAIDDEPAGDSEEFRRKVRRAMVRQGDCLVTVTRGDKTIDLPVFFPHPK